MGSLSALSVSGAAFAQPYPMVDAAADKLVQKYQSAASCQQLWAERAAAQSRPRSPAEQRAMQLLHQDAGARAEFIGRIGATIAHKMLECGMIP